MLDKSGVCKKSSDTVAQFILDKINSIKTFKIANSFLVFIGDFEFGNSIGMAYETVSESTNLPQKVPNLKIVFSFPDFQFSFYEKPNTNAFTGVFCG